MVCKPFSVCFDCSFPCLRQTGLHFSVDKNEAKISLNLWFLAQSHRPATPKFSRPTLLFRFWKKQRLQLYNYLTRYNIPSEVSSYECSQRFIKPTLLHSYHYYRGYLWKRTYFLVPVFFVGNNKKS